MLKLIEPIIEHKDSFEKFLESFQGLHNLHGSGIIDEIYLGIEEFLERIERYKKGLDTTYTIPSTTYWLMDDENVIGTLNLRHSLNDFLLKEGGHIGYSIHPDYRGKGLGTEILKLGLEKSKELNITRVLITCDDGNVPSEKIILANGGEYENTIEGVKRFWVDNN